MFLINGFWVSPVYYFFFSFLFFALHSGRCIAKDFHATRANPESGPQIRGTYSCPADNTYCTGLTGPDGQSGWMAAHYVLAGNMDHPTIYPRPCGADLDIVRSQILNFDII